MADQAPNDTLVALTAEKKREAERALAALMAAIYTWHPHLEQWHVDLGRKVRPTLIQPQEFSAFTMKSLSTLPGYDALRAFGASVICRYAPDTFTRGGTILVLEMV